MDASNILKPAMARGEIQIIGATTLEEYRKHIEKDAALERRFQPVKVEPASVEQTIKILKGLRPYYESHHQVQISDFGPFGHRFRYLFFCHDVGTLTPTPVLFFLQQMFQPFHFLFAIVGFLKI